MDHKPSLYYYANIKAFMKKFLVDGKNQFSFQKYIKPIKKFGYFPEPRQLTQEDFTKHFYYGGRETQNEIMGSLAIRPSVDGWLKFVVFDIDRKHQKEEFLKLVPPELSKYGLRGILEHGGDNFDRCKYWIPIHCTIDTARHLIFQIGEDTGLNFNNPANKETYYDEIFGVNKVDFVLRVPDGYHITRKAVFPIEIGDELTTNPDDFIREFLACPQPHEDELKPLLRPLREVRAEREVKEVTTKNFSTFYYTPRGLKLPINPELIPNMLKPVYKNCQAAHKVLEGIVNEDFIEERGDQYHHAGLFTYGMAIFSDIKRSRTTRQEIINGREFAKYLELNYRSRSADSHSWETNRNKAEANPDRLFPSCQAWEKKFGLCEGCPWKGRIKSPKSFIYGKQIQRKVLKNVKLVTPEEIRTQTFPLIEQRINQLVNDNCSGTILLASPQNAGKSYISAKWAAKLAKLGRNVLVAVPNVDLAMEWRNWIREEGEDAFVLFSHKSTFRKKEELGLTFNCPYYERIQTMVDLGVSSGTYKEQFCSKCPFFNQCYYPRQYTEVKEDQYKVVIIQHAHLQCQEVIYELLKKNFDVLFVDESFVKSTFDSIQIKPIEKEILSKIDSKWAVRLLRWVECKDKATGKLDPSESELASAQRAFKSANIEWRIPQFIRFFNQHRLVNPYTGIEVIYELPDIPVKVFTDATPPEELLKRLTGLDNIEIWGADEVIDVTRIHPENEIIQVLDTSASRTFLDKDDNLEVILLRIGEIVEEQLKDKKVLITVSSKSMQQTVKQFFLDHKEEFPTPIEVGLMSKGVNTWKEFDAQFLLAGRYAHGGEYLEEVYKYKCVSNYYRYKHGVSPENNPYYQDLQKKSVSVPPYKDDKDQMGIPVRRIEKLKGVGVLFEYSDFRVFPPADVWPSLCYEYNSGETQQAIRIRFDSSKGRRVWILSNLNLPSVLVTKSVLLNEFLNN